MKRIIPKNSKPEDVQRAMELVLRDVTPDKAWSVTVEEVKPRRSDAQNAFLWAVVYPSFLEGGGEALKGFRATDLHEWFLGDMWGWETLEGFGRKRMRPVRRSSTMTKQEFSDYIAFIEQKALDMGIVIPEPNYPGDENA
ncbi:MAG: hypothetical protein QM523_00105 [Candidatus Pacebacteria bacterium]|nr:hypothetical protein [Candidatus Paceibacterota bacterium]